MNGQSFKIKIQSKRSGSNAYQSLRKVYRSIMQRLARSSELQVWHHCDQSGQITWSAYDPETKRSIDRLSEQQMRIWIEQRYR